MADAPTTHKVLQTPEDGKVVVEGFDAVLDLVPKGTTATVGQELRGWLNREGKWGPYLKVAEDRPLGVSNGAGGQRDDATGRSIERQVAAKAAAEMAAAVGGSAPELDANFEGLFDTVIAKIQGGSGDPPF